MSSIIHRSSTFVEDVHGDGLERLGILLSRCTFLISIRCLSTLELDWSDALADLHLLYFTSIVFNLVSLIKFGIAFGGLTEDICSALARLNLSQFTLIQFWWILLLIDIVSARRLSGPPCSLQAISTRVCCHIISELIAVLCVPL